jgi:Ca2+/Na+ antiporter
MNRSKFRNIATAAKACASKLGKRTAAFGTAMLASGAALAQTASEAETIITTQKDLALAVVVAGTVAILAIRYTKLARRA